MTFDIWWHMFVVWEGFKISPSATPVYRLVDQTTTVERLMVGRSNNSAKN